MVEPIEKFAVGTNVAEVTYAKATHLGNRGLLVLDSGGVALIEAVAVPKPDKEAAEWRRRLQ